MSTDQHPDTSLQLISLRKAARHPLLQVDGRGPHATAIWRWATRGVNGVRLRTRLVGGKRATTLLWIEEFLEHSTREADKHAQQPKAQATAGRIERLKRELKEKLQ